MILPNKYVPIEDSFIGISARILKLLSNKSFTIDRLWTVFSKKYNKNYENVTYQKFTQVVVFMYSIKMINYNDQGEIHNENQKHKNI